MSNYNGNDILFLDGVDHGASCNKCVIKENCHYNLPGGDLPYMQGSLAERKEQL